MNPHDSLKLTIYYTTKPLKNTNRPADAIKSIFLYSQVLRCYSKILHSPTVKEWMDKIK